jgi:hypothetical protein
MSDKKQVEMFKFKVNQVQDVSAEEFEAFEKEAEGGGSKFFDDPGSYELRVTEVKTLGPQTSDSTWVGLIVKLASVTDQTISMFLAVPTCNLNYVTKSGSTTKFMYKKYKEFLTALGIPDVTQANVLTFAPKLFSEGKIIDLSVQGILNYEGAYAKFHGKTDDGVSYVLIQNNEVVTNVETDTEGVHQPLLFPNRDAVEAEAIQMGISDFQGFISLIGYGDCPNPAQIPSGKVKAKPKAVSKTAKIKDVASGEGW